MSIITFSSSVGGFAILPLMSLVIGLMGWRAGCFFIAAALCVFAVVIPWFTVKNRPEDIGQTPDGGSGADQVKENRKVKLKTLYTTPVEFSLGDAMRTKALWLIAYGFVASQFLSSVMTTHQIAFLENIGIDGITGALAAGLMYGVGIFGALGIGVLGLSVNMWRLNIIAIGIIVSGCFLLLAAGTLTFVYLYNIIIGIGLGAFNTGYIAQLSAYYGRGNFPKIMGVVFSFGTILGATGSLVGGVLYDVTGSYRAAFAVITLIFIFSFLCIIFAKPPVHPAMKGNEAIPAGPDSEMK
jgi:cyanate permease